MAIRWNVNTKLNFNGIVTVSYCNCRWHLNLTLKLCKFNEKKVFEVKTGIQVRQIFGNSRKRYKTTSDIKSSFSDKFCSSIVQCKESKIQQKEFLPIYIIPTTFTCTFSHIIFRCEFQPVPISNISSIFKIKIFISNWFQSVLYNY